MASIVKVNYCRMDGTTLGAGLLNLAHVCMITRNEEDTLTVVHFSVRRSREEFNQCCYVEESIEELHALSLGKSLDNSKAKALPKRKVEEPEGMPFYN